MSEKNNQPKKNTLFKVYIALAIILSSAFWVFILYSDVNYVEGSYSIAQADQPTVSSLELNINNPNLGIQIEPLAADSNLLYVIDWEYGSIGFKMEDLGEPTIINTTIGTVLQLNISIPEIQYDDHFVQFNTYSIYVYHHPSMPIALDIETNTGSVDIFGKDIEYTHFEVISTTGSIDTTLSDSQITGDLNIGCTTGSVYMIGTNLNVTGNLGLDTTTGSLDVTLTNSIIEGNIASTSSVGSIDMDLINVELGGNEFMSHSSTGSKTFVFSDIKLAQDVMVNLTGNTGSLDWEWTQTKALGANMSVIAEQSTGSITLNLMFNTYLGRFNIVGSAETGSVNIYGNPELTKIGTDHYQSANYDQVTFPLIDLDLTTSTGSITVNADYERV